MHISKKNITRICCINSLLMIFSAVTLFPAMITANADENTQNGGERTVCITQSAAMCTPPDTERDSDNAEFSERHTAPSGRIRTCAGLSCGHHYTARLSFSECKTADSVPIICFIRRCCGTVMLC